MYSKAYRNTRFLAPGRREERIRHCPLAQGYTALAAAGAKAERLLRTGLDDPDHYCPRCSPSPS
jgi:hypothetical protein